MPHPLGLGHFTFLDLPPADLMRLAADTGFNFVGLRLFPIAPGELAYDLTEGSADWTEVSAIMAGEGIGIYDIETIVVGADFNPETLRPALEQSASLGARRLNICGDDPDPLRQQDTFNQICALAAPYDISVDIECMKWRVVNTVTRCAEIVAASQAENAGVLIDTLHLSRCGGTTADLAKIPPQHLRSVQLCDAGAIAPITQADIIAEARGGRMPPGDGALPLAEIIAALPAEAVFSVELPMASDLPVRERAQMIYDKTQALLRATRPEQSL